MIDTSTPADRATYVLAQGYLASPSPDTSDGRVTLYDHIRRCPTTQKSGYIALRYAPHSPKFARDIATT